MDSKFLGSKKLKLKQNVSQNPSNSNPPPAQVSPRCFFFLNLHVWFFSWGTFLQTERTPARAMQLDGSVPVVEWNENLRWLCLVYPSKHAFWQIEWRCFYTVYTLYHEFSRCSSIHLFNMKRQAVKNSLRRVAKFIALDFRKSRCCVSRWRRIAHRLER